MENLFLFLNKSKDIWFKKSLPTLRLVCGGQSHKFSLCTCYIYVIQQIYFLVTTLPFLTFFVCLKPQKGIVYGKKYTSGPRYWNVPVLVNTGTLLVYQYCPKMWYLCCLEHAGGIQKQRIQEHQIGLVLSNTHVPVSGTWSTPFPQYILQMSKSCCSTFMVISPPPSKSNYFANLLISKQYCNKCWFLYHNRLYLTCIWLKMLVQVRYL